MVCQKIRSWVASWEASECSFFLGSDLLPGAEALIQMVLVHSSSWHTVGPHKCQTIIVTYVWVLTPRLRLPKVTDYYPILLGSWSPESLSHTARKVWSGIETQLIWFQSTGLELHTSVPLLPETSLDGRAHRSGSSLCPTNSRTFPQPFIHCSFPSYFLSSWSLPLPDWASGHRKDPDMDLLSRKQYVFTRSHMLKCCSTGRKPEWIKQAGWKVIGNGWDYGNMESLFSWRIMCGCECWTRSGILTLI